MGSRRYRGSSNQVRSDPLAAFVSGIRNASSLFDTSDGQMFSHHLDETGTITDIYGARCIAVVVWRRFSSASYATKVVQSIMEIHSLSYFSALYSATSININLATSSTKFVILTFSSVSTENVVISNISKQMWLIAMIKGTSDNTLDFENLNLFLHRLQTDLIER